MRKSTSSFVMATWDAAAWDRPTVGSPIAAIAWE